MMDLFLLLLLIAVIVRIEFLNYKGNKKKDIELLFEQTEFLTKETKTLFRNDELLDKKANLTNDMMKSSCEQILRMNDLILNIAKEVDKKDIDQAHYNLANLMYWFSILNRLKLISLEGTTAKELSLNLYKDLNPVSFGQYFSKSEKSDVEPANSEKPS